MLATTWSKPIATKAMIGKTMARILPADVAASDIHTARHTSQLQPTRAGICHGDFAAALPTAIARAGRRSSPR